MQDTVNLPPVLGDTQKGCEKAGIFLGYPMHWYNLFLHRESSTVQGKCKVTTVNMMEGRMMEGCFHGTPQDEQPDLEFLSDSRNVWC